MAITSRLLRRLSETFENGAGEDLVDWMQGVDAHRAELRERLDLSASRFEARLEQAKAELRYEMQVGFAAVERRIGQLETRIEQRTADLMKWSFVFWIGSVAAVAGAVAALDRFLH